MREINKSMSLKNLYKSIKNKSWNLIEKKYNSQSFNALNITNRLKILYYSNIQLKKTKLLIIFSIVIASITAINESIVLYSIFKTYGSLLFSDNIETIVKTIMINMIPIVGFIGSLYLLLRRTAGLWLVGVWCSLLIIPIFFSYNDNGHILAQNYFNYYNTSPLIQAFYIQSQSIMTSSGIDYQYNLNYIVKYSPYASGIGVNVVPVLYLFAVFLLILQNKKLFIKKNLISFMLLIAFSVIVPFLVYSSVNIFQNSKRDEYEMKKFELQASSHYSQNSQHSLYERCYQFSRPWFLANKNKIIKQVSCRNNNEIVNFTK